MQMFSEKIEKYEQARSTLEAFVLPPKGWAEHSFNGSKKRSAWEMMVDYKVDKQLSEIARFKKEETLVLPIDLDYWQLNSLSIEEKVSATHRQHPSPLPSFLQLTQHALF